MRIISKFHDYYDGAMRNGVDQDVFYIRENKEEKLDKNPYPSIKKSHGLNYEISIKILGFCGNLYKVICATYQGQSNGVKNYLDQEYFYSIDSFKKFAEEEGIEIDWNQSKRRSWLSFWDFKYGRDFEKYYANLDLSSFSHIFATYQVPLFLYSQGSGGYYYLEQNPSLKNLAFFKEKDVFSCYQELYMYVSGVLNRKESEMVKISDKDKIHKHGFNKYSFRKMPKKG